MRQKVVMFFTKITSFIILHCASSCIWVSTERPKVCYKKYLGPDWKPDYDFEHCGSIVSNHSSFLDTLVHTMFSMCCFIAKEEVKKIPGIGLNARNMKCLFIDREAGKTGKSIQDLITQRQI